MSVRIARARGADDLATVAGMFRDYQRAIGVDLCFQGFAEELATLPGRYAPPGGEILLARDETGAAIGCIALRPLEDEAAAEIKRLYVRPAGRGKGVGRLLVEAALALAREIGYREVRLDTLPQMEAAIALYRSLGFVPTGNYNASPLAGIMHFQFALKLRWA